MKSLLPVRILFYVSAAYDGLLGLAFLLAGPQLYQWVGITPPNHWGYVHFAAAVLVLFGYMFLRVALHPLVERNLILFGIQLKICYVGTVAWHWAHDGLPMLWKYFAVADVGFALLFCWSVVFLDSVAKKPAAS